MGMGRKGVRFQEEVRKWRISDLLYSDDLILCGESKEDLRATVGRFIKMCWRRALKVSTYKSKVMMLKGGRG